jgi:putative membrane protein
MAERGPDLRILQANERTLLAWIRTGLALMAFGFVIGRIAVWLKMEHPERGESSVSLGVGIAIVAVGAACQGIGAVRFVRARRAIVDDKPIVPGATAPVVIAIVVAVAGLGLAGYLAISGQ